MVRRCAPPALALLALCLALPLAAGVTARHVHRSCVAQLAEQWEGRAVVRTESYSLGWWTSRAVLIVEPPGASPVQSVRIEETIAHGPLPWLDVAAGRFPRPSLALVQGDWRPDLPAAIASALGGRPPLRVRARVGLDRRVSIELESPPLSGPDLEWSGVRGRAEFSRSGGWGSIEAPGLRWSGAPVPVRMESLRAGFHLRVSRVGLALEDWTASLGSAELGVSGAEPHWELGGFQLGQTSEEHGELVDTWLRGGFERGVLGADAYGSAVLEIGVRNLDVVVLSVLRAKLRKAAEDSALPGARAAALMAGLPALLQSEPVLELARLHVDTPGGPLDWSGRLWIEAPPAGALDPWIVLARLRADARLVTPSRLLHRFVERRIAQVLGVADVEGWTPEHLQVIAVRTKLFERWRSQGGLQSEGDAYVMRVRVGESGLHLNGLPFDPARIGVDIASAARASMLEPRPEPPSFPAAPAP